MTADLERPRRAKGEPMSAYSERREAYVAAHRRERNKRHVITERTERIVERIEPVEDEATKRRLQEAEDALAWLMEPGEPEPEYIDLSERPVEEVVGPLEALKAKIDRVRKTGSIDPSGVDDLEPLKPDDLINMVADNPPGSAAELENAVRGIRGDARRRLTELLNVELSGLEQERAVGSSHADPKREQQIEYLLGLFARLGEI